MVDCIADIELWCRSHGSSSTPTSLMSSGLAPDSNSLRSAKLRIYTSRVARASETARSHLLDSLLLPSPSYSTDQTVHRHSVIASTGPRVYHVASRLLQRTACELRRCCSPMVVANSEQCRSFISLLRTSLSHGPLLYSLHWLPVTTHKVQIMRSDVWRFPWHGACVSDWSVRRTRTRFAGSSFTVAGPAASLPAHPDDWLAPCVLPSPKNLSAHCSWMV